MSKIKPKIVNGEPVCDPDECSQYGHNSDIGSHCKIMDNEWCEEGLPCIPGLRQQLADEKAARVGTEAALQDIANWRSKSHEYDDDMDHERRHFGDDEEWNLLEKFAQDILNKTKSEE